MFIRFTLFILPCEIAQKKFVEDWSIKDKNDWNPYKRN